MANNQNLKSWKPGQSGNPKGKPKGTRHLSTMIREMLDDPSFTYDLGNGRKVKGRAGEAMIKVLIDKAVSGDIKAFDSLARFGYGNKVDITSNDKQLPTPLLAGLVDLETVE